MSNIHMTCSLMVYCFSGSSILEVEEIILFEIILEAIVVIWVTIEVVIIGVEIITTEITTRNRLEFLNKVKMNQL